MNETPVTTTSGSFSRTPPTRLRGPFLFHPRDILAGLGVALVLIPQSLAYAELAGVPAHHGLYVAALAPMMAPSTKRGIVIATRTVLSSHSLRPV